MEIIFTEFLDENQKERVFQLWNSEYPSRICYKNSPEFETYLASLNGTNHYLLVSSQFIFGWAMTFIRDNEIWFVIILDSKINFRGYGSQLLRKLKEKFNELNGWVVDHNNDYKKDGSIYKSPLTFYLKNGFELLSELRIENEKISAVKIKWENKMGK